jgi:hypothetical protein
MIRSNPLRSIIGRINLKKTLEQLRKVFIAREDRKNGRARPRE